jgi:hypothetical protein
MKAEQAWKFALDQLHMEIPKATFDSWVRGARFESYEDGVFEVGVTNEYTREWLEGRLSSTVTRLLTGLMNRSVQVHFFVHDPDSGEEEDVQGDRSALRLSEEEKQYKIKLAHASLRDEFIHPHRVTVIPGYFQRWLPYLGPTLAWIVVAFRQAMFMATHQEACAEVNFAVSPSSVARWAGIYRTTLWRRLDDKPLGWFLKRIQRGDNVFRFIASMPLTPGDAEALSAWLTAVGVCEDPISALEKALATESGFTLPTPPPPPTQAHLDMDPNPQSVQDIVLRVCGRIEKKAMLNKILRMADQLTARLMPPGDAIYVTHYFLLHHLPELGAAPAWLVTLLRDRCYTSKDNPRDSVWIRGGYTEIARMLGLQRPKTISEWLPAVFENKTNPRHSHIDIPSGNTGHERRAELRVGRRSLLQQFITRAEYQTSFNTPSCGFKVSLIEPLSPEDQGVYDWVIDQAGTYLETGDRSAIDILLNSNNQDPMCETQMQREEQAWTDHDGANATGLLPEKARMQHEAARLHPDVGGNATPSGVYATPERRTCNTKRRGCNTLNPLNLLVKLLEQLDLNSLNPGPGVSKEEITSQVDEKAEPVVVVEPIWDLLVLFTRNPAVKADTQKKLEERKASAQAFVSWLLYAASPNGRGISRPAQFAASKLIANPQTGSGSSYNHLAALPPKCLYELIDESLVGTRHNATVPPEGWDNWQSVMTNASAERIQALKKQLFG